MLANKLELNYYPEEVYEEPIKKDFKNKSKKRNTKRTKSKSKFNVNAFIKTMFLFSGLIVMGISLFILIRYANITKTRMELTKMETQMVELEKVKLDLLAELEGIKSSPIIVDQAINKLGMNYPKKDQIAYVSLIEEDLVIDLGAETTENSIGRIFSLISSLF